MGAAAYYRGNAVITAQINRDLGIPEPNYKPTPRPADWGSKVRAKADKRAAGILHYWTVLQGREAPTMEDLADMIQQGIGCGRSTAEDAAQQALADKKGHPMTITVTIATQTHPKGGHWYTITDDGPTGVGFMQTSAIGSDLAHDDAADRARALRDEGYTVRIVEATR